MIACSIDRIDYRKKNLPLNYTLVSNTFFCRYTCCTSKCNNNHTAVSSNGCCTAKSHVWRGRLFQMPGLHGPFKNFIRTKGRKCNPPNGYHGVYALDGEMCYTTQGMELIRLSVVRLKKTLLITFRGTRTHQDRTTIRTGAYQVG